MPIVDKFYNAPIGHEIKIGSRFGKKNSANTINYRGERHKHFEMVIEPNCIVAFDYEDPELKELKYLLGVST